MTILKESEVIEESVKKAFKEYFYSFYDNRPELKVSDKEFEIILNARINDDEPIDFEGDSYDREVVRDLILDYKGLEPIGFLGDNYDILDNFSKARKEIEININNYINDMIRKIRLNQENN